MLNTIRKGNFLQHFWVVMALYILNCCVDTPDININTVHENLLINDQESVIEIIVEKVFRHENAIPESDDADCEDTSLKKNLSLDTFTIAVILQIPKPGLFPKEFPDTYSERSSHFTKTLHIPPPEIYFS